MGKKRALGAGTSATSLERTSQYWCYYCGVEAKDEGSLIRHQTSKHFRCPLCEPRSAGGHCISLAGLFSHVRRSHGKELDKVPGAIEGRENPRVEVYGMTGIPGEDDGNAEVGAAAFGQPRIVAPPPKEPKDLDLLSAAAAVARATPRPRPALAAVQAPAALAAGLAAPLTAPMPSAGANFRPTPPMDLSLHPLVSAAPALAPAPAHATSVAELLSLAATLQPPALLAQSVSPPSVGAPVLGTPPSTTSAVAAAVMLPKVYGRWRHSSGGDIVVSPGVAGSVIVQHYMLGEQTISASDFVVAGKLKFCQHEGTFASGCIQWSNGSVWTKTL